METIAKGRTEVIDKINELESTTYNSELFNQIRQLDGFKPLCWTPRVRQLYYDSERQLLLSNVEGDLRLWRNPDEGTIEGEVQKYPKPEVSLGEKFDSRF
jgi:hypothetical protein